MELCNESMSPDEVASIYGMLILLMQHVAPNCNWMKYFVAHCHRSSYVNTLCITYVCGNRCLRAHILDLLDTFRPNNTGRISISIQYCNSALLLSGWVKERDALRIYSDCNALLILRRSVAMNGRFELVRLLIQFHWIKIGTSATCAVKIRDDRFHWK